MCLLFGLGDMLRLAALPNIVLVKLWCLFGGAVLRVASIM